MWKRPCSHSVYIVHRPLELIGMMLTKISVVRNLRVLQKSAKYSFHYRCVHVSQDTQSFSLCSLLCD